MWALFFRKIFSEHSFWLGFRTDVWVPLTMFVEICSNSFAWSSIISKNTKALCCVKRCKARRRLYSDGVCRTFRSDSCRTLWAHNCALTMSTFMRWTRIHSSRYASRYVWRECSSVFLGMHSLSCVFEPHEEGELHLFSATHQCSLFTLNDEPTLFVERRIEVYLCFWCREGTSHEFFGRDARENPLTCYHPHILLAFYQQLLIEKSISPFDFYPGVKDPSEAYF